MFRRPKNKFSKEKSDYDKVRKKLSFRDKLILFGTTDAVAKGFNALERKLTQQIMKMFYLYLSHELYETNQTNKEFQTMYTFLDKCILRKNNCISFIKKSDLDELKQVLNKYYIIFMQNTLNNHILKDELCRATNSINYEYLSISDHSKRIIQYLHDYIDFIDMYYVSKRLALDSFIMPTITKKYIQSSDKNLSKKTNKNNLNRGINARVLEIKMSLLNQTMITIKEDLKIFLTDKKYTDVKNIIMNNYDEYYRKLDRFIHLKGNFASKIKKQKSTFEIMDSLQMNWICKCSDINGGGSKYFYLFVYDIVMYKFRLWAYLLQNEWNMKTKKEVLEALEKDTLKDEEERTFDFFTRHIRNEGNINAHIIKLFGKKDQKFIQNILVIKSKKEYEKKEVTPIFFSLVNMNYRHTILDSLKYFPIRGNGAWLNKKKIQAGSKSNIRSNFRNYMKRKQRVLENLSQSDTTLNSKVSYKKDVRLHKS